MRGTYLEDEATFFKPKLEWAAASTSTVSPDEKEFVVDSGASMHVMSMTDVSPEELETVKVCRLPTTVMTATGSIDTTEEGIVCGKDLDMLVTVQLLEDTPEVLNLGEPCEENGHSHEWTQAQTPLFF